MSAQVTPIDRDTPTIAGSYRTSYRTTSRTWNRRRTRPPRPPSSRAATPELDLRPWAVRNFAEPRCPQEISTGRYAGDCRRPPRPCRRPSTKPLKPHKRDWVESPCWLGRAKRDHLAHQCGPRQGDHPVPSQTSCGRICSPGKRPGGHVVLTCRDSVGSQTSALFRPCEWAGPVASRSSTDSQDGSLMRAVTPPSLTRMTMPVGAVTHGRDEDPCGSMTPGRPPANCRLVGHRYFRSAAAAAWAWRSVRQMPFLPTSCSM